MTLAITIKSDTSAATALIDELAKLSVNAPDGFVERLLSIGDGAGQLFSLDRNGVATPGTGELTFALKPTEFMNRLMATARAGDFDLSVFDHVSSSDGSVSRSIEGSPPGESQGPSGGQPTNNPARPSHV